MRRANEAPRGWQADTGQAGGILIPDDALTGNAAALRLARLRLMGLGGAVAALVAAVAWGAGDAR
jgi:hypothetical protein